MAIVPFSNGVGLVSYQFDNISMVYMYREKMFLSYSDQNCVPAFFPPFSGPIQPVFGYCLDLPFHRIDAILVRVNFETLNSSYFVLPVTNFVSYNFQSDTLLSNFLFFTEESTTNCFTVETGRTIFLTSSNLVDHFFFDDEYIEVGSINVPACSTSEPRLQSLITPTECKLAAYCNGTTALFNVPDSFNGPGSGVTLFSGDVFFCSPNSYVRFLNNSFSVHRVSATSEEQVSGSVSLNAEVIFLGDCLTSEAQFYFVASLSDARTIFVNFTNLSISVVGENANPMLLPYIILDKLLYVNNGTHSLVYNWTRMCHEDVIVVPRNFDLVHSFIIDQSLPEECGCTTQETATTAIPIDNTTTTNQMDSTTFAMSITEATSRPATEPPTISSPATAGLNVGQIAGIAIGVGVVVLVLCILAVGIFIYLLK